MSSPQSIDFKGQWIEAEKELIASAVADIEGLQAGRRRATPWTTPWVATCDRSMSANMFAISRTGISAVLVAREAGALAEKIRGLDSEQVCSDFLSPPVGE